MMFVPGHRGDWLRKAPKYGSDALIFDLEDAVPQDRKAEGRAEASAALRELADAPVALFVRLNAWGTGRLPEDLDAVVGPGLDGVMLPKTALPKDVEELDRELTARERAAGLPEGRIEILPLMETALSMYRNYDILVASDRIRRAGGGGSAVPNGDSIRAIGCEWTEEGLETLYVNSKMILEARAAGIEHILGGMSSFVDDLDFVRRALMAARQLGANSSLCIHPSHIPIIHEVYTPSTDAVQKAQDIIEAMGDAIASGLSAVRWKDEMIDYAQVRHSVDLLGRAQQAGIDVTIPAWAAAID
jgi:citrate lyase subunit beta/citryl-CoA lyase